MKRFRNSPYLVTTCGKVWSEKSNRFIAQRIDKDGYSNIHIYIDGKQRWYRVCRVVAECYIPNPDNKPQVNHKNGDKSKNYVRNLEWNTQSENIKHAFASGLMKPNTKSVIQILDGKIIGRYDSILDASNKTGVNYTSISSMCNDHCRCTNAGGYEWRFEDDTDTNN